MKISFTLAIIGFIAIILFRQSGSKYAWRFQVVGGFLFFQLFVVGAITLWLKTSDDDITRYRMREKLEDRSYQLYLNGELMDSLNTSLLVKELSQMDRPNYHNSDPKENFQLTMISKIDTLNVVLGQDSEFPTEYWVFWRESNSNDEIGKINWEDKR